jgi:MYXO-CTERM domain-containing protein
MTSRLFLRGSLATLFALGALGAARTAAANPTSCSADSDCTKGFTCQVEGMSTCPGVVCVSPAGDLDAAVCPPPPVCGPPQVIKGCLPGPCTMDSDCATGMVCYADTYTNCGASVPVASCPPNADCAVPAVDAGACSTATMKSCVPSYDLPCTVDSDCGDGFTCVPDTITSCSGSGSASPGSGPIDASVTAVEAGTVGVGAFDGGSFPPPSCTTTTGSTSSCQAKTITCATNADCPSTWTCVAQPQAVSNICAGPASLDGGVPVCGSPDPGPPQMLCEPPYADLGTGSGGGALSGNGSAPVAASGSPNANGGAVGSRSAPTGSSGGCQMATPGTGSGGVSLLALLGLTTVLSRRRRRES